MKHLASLALTLALATLPAWAAADYGHIQWIENIPGITVQSSHIEDDGELEVEYTFTSEKVYDQVITGLRSRGWRMVKQEADRDCPGLPDVKMMKDNTTLEIDMDRERTLNGEVYEMEISIE